MDVDTCRLSPGYVYGAPSYVGGVGASVGAGTGGLVQLPQIQHAAAVAAANHLYEYQAAAAQGAAAYQQQYAAAGFDPYATAAGSYYPTSHSSATIGWLEEISRVE